VNLSITVTKPILSINNKNKNKLISCYTFSSAMKKYFFYRRNDPYHYRKAIDAAHMQLAEEKRLEEVKTFYHRSIRWCILLILFILFLFGESFKGNYKLNQYEGKSRTCFAVTSQVDPVQTVPLYNHTANVVQFEYCSIDVKPTFVGKFEQVTMTKVDSDRMPMDLAPINVTNHYISNFVITSTAHSRIQPTCTQLHDIILSYWLYSIINEDVCNRTDPVIRRLMIRLRYEAARNFSGVQSRIYWYYLYGDPLHILYAGWTINKIVPAFPQYGPGYSSDNSADGPTRKGLYNKFTGQRAEIPAVYATPAKSALKLRSDGDDIDELIFQPLPTNDLNFSALPPYSTKDFRRWVTDFLNILPSNLDEIFTGTETLLKPCESGAGLVNYRNSIQRHKYAYRAIYHCISKSTDPRKEEAQSICDAHNNLEPYEIWEDLQALHHETSVSNKLEAVFDLLNISQGPQETTLEYKARHDDAYKRVEILKVNLSDIRVALYLLRLDPTRYRDLIRQTSLDEAIPSMEDVFVKVRRWDQQQALSKSQEKANSAATSPAQSDQQKQLPTMIKQAVQSALQAFAGGRGGAGRGGGRGGRHGGGRSGGQYSHGRGGGGGGGARQSQRDPNIALHPFTPTPAEQSQTCRTCNTPGHVTRTCYKNSTFIKLLQENGLPTSHKGKFRDREAGDSEQKKKKRKREPLRREQARMAIVQGIEEFVFERVPSPPPVELSSDGNAPRQQERAYVTVIQPGNTSSSHPAGPHVRGDENGDGPEGERRIKRHRGASVETAALSSVAFMADSGCTHHMVPATMAHLVINPRPYGAGTVKVASGHELPIQTIGQMGPLRSVVTVDGLDQPLFSIRQACEEGHVAVFDRSGVHLYPEGSVVCQSPPVLSGNVSSDRSYYVAVSPSEAMNERAFLASVAPSNAYTLWHQRLGHLSQRVLYNMVKNKSAVGLPFKDKVDFSKQVRSHQCGGICSGCAISKLTRTQPTRRSKTEPDNKHPVPGRLVFADVLFSPNESIRGHYSCALLLVDCDTKYLWVYPMRNKGETPHHVRQWIQWMTAHGKPVSAMTTLRTDNGTEFVNADLDAIISAEGLKRSLAAPYAHCYTAERAIRTVQTAARSMMLAANITPGFWAEALLSAVYTLNRVTTTTNSKKTRHELFHGVKPDISNIRTFGCEVWVANAPPTNPTEYKWLPHALPGRFMGYSEDRPNQWKVWIPSKRDFFFTNCLIFDENVKSRPVLTPAEERVVISSPEDEAAHRELITGDLFNSIDLSSPALVPASDESAEESGPALGGSGGRAGGAYPRRPSVAATAPESLDEPDDDDTHRRSERIRKPSRYLSDDIWTIQKAHSVKTVFNRASEWYSSLTQYMYHAFVSDVQTDNERRIPDEATMSRLLPANLDEATDPTFPNAANWIQAIMAEVESIRSHGTLTIMRRFDPAVRSIRMLPGVKWVFRIKENIHGHIERFKARCTVLGNTQKEGIDYEETFAPVVRFDTVRMLLAIAARERLLLHQMDVDTAFLYGEMTGEPSICIPVPPLYPIPDELKGVPRDQLCARVDKSLYGLKQAPRIWNKHINRTMSDLGFTRAAKDHCLYIRRDSASGKVLYVTIYVDDLIIAGSDLEVINQFKGEISTVYSMKDLGELRYCLGMEVNRNPETGVITVNQTKYIDDVLKRFRLNGDQLKTHKVPMDPSIKLSKAQAPTTAAEKVKADAYPYREIVGSLMYLMICTRPDIAYAVGQLARYMNCHGESHHRAARHLLGYLKETRSHGLTYGLDTGPLHLTGYSDSDWGADIDTRRSTSGYVFFLAGGPITWKSKLQPTVALSSTEAEYMALTPAAQEAISLRELFAELTGIDESVQMFGDNKSSIALSENPTSHQASKHIAIKHHFVREKVRDKDILLAYIPTASMVADALTKALPYPTFSRLCRAMFGIEPHGITVPG